MSITNESARTQIGEIWSALEACLARLPKHKRLDESALADLQTAQELLTALPLATDQFALATQRLRNAARYLKSQEAGAAGYELRMLAAALRSLLTPASPASPNRRLRIG